MQTLTTKERDAVAALCLMAAFADGRSNDHERDRLRSVFAALDADFSPERYERVLLGQVSVEAEADRIASPAVRTLAYEMAVAICDADGSADAAEQDFLKRLRAALDLDADAADEIDATGEALLMLPLDDRAEAGAPWQAEDEVAPPLSPFAVTPQGQVAVADVDPDAELNAMILRYAVLAGGLELLPQKVATLAVVPMQTKMVYRIGLRYGHRLDARHVKELLGTVGLGLTAQVVETYARGLFGGLAQATLGTALGGKKKKKRAKKAKKVAAAAAGSAFAFAATFALGHVAKAYYGGGRRLSPDALRTHFDQLLGQGRALYETHRPAIEERARTIDLSTLTSQFGTA